MDTYCHGCAKKLTPAQIGKMCHKCAKPHCMRCSEAYPGNCCASCMGTGDVPRYKGDWNLDGNDTGNGSGQGNGQGSGTGDGTGDGDGKGEGQGQGQGDGQGEGENGEGNQAEELSQGKDEDGGMESEESVSRKVRHSMHKQSGKDIDDKLWSVQLTDVGQKKIILIKAIRDLVGMGIKEAKDLTDTLEATGRKPFIAVGVSTRDAVINAVRLMMAGAKVKVIPYGDHKEQPKPDNKGEEGGNGPKQFKVRAHFTMEQSELGQSLMDQGLTRPEALEVLLEGRFGRHGEVTLTCLLVDGSVEVIDCDYLD